MLHLLNNKGILVSQSILRRTMTEEKYGGCSMQFLTIVLLSLRDSSLEMG